MTGYGGKADSAGGAKPGPPALSIVTYKKGLAEFAPAGAKRIGIIFRGDMRLAKRISIPRPR